MVEPQRFIPILTYTSKAGKREYAKWVYDLDLPEPAAVSWTIRQLIFWSNDLLVELAGEGFEARSTWVSSFPIARPKRTAQA